MIVVMSVVVIVLVVLNLVVIVQMDHVKMVMHLVMFLVE